MANELSDIVVANTRNIQELQAGELTSDWDAKYKFMNEFLSGADTLTAKKRYIGLEFNLGRSRLAGSGIGSSYDKIRGYGLDVAKESYDAGLLGLYHFDEETTATTLDSSVNGNNAVAISGTSVVPGKYNFSNAREFNGTSDMINLGNPASMNLAGGSNFTIEAWARTTLATGKVLISKGAIAARTVDIGLNSAGAQETSFYLLTNNGAVNITYGTPISGNWVHYAYTYDAAFMRIYKNGVCVQSGAQTGTVVGTGSSWVIGNFYDGPAYYFKGRIDDVAIYNYAKTTFKNSYQPPGGSGWEVVTL